MDRAFIFVRDPTTTKAVPLETDQSGRLPVTIGGVAAGVLLPITVQGPLDVTPQVATADVAANNPMPGLLRATDGLGNWWNLGVDQATMVLNTLTYEHHEIHSGSHFYVAGHTTLGLNGVIEFVIAVPDTTKWPHMIFWWVSSNNLTAEMFEGTTGVVGGTPVTPRNSNRNSAVVSGLTIVSDPASIAVDGTLIWSAAWGSKQQGGRVGRDNEIILKQNTNYLWRATSGANGNVISYEGLWYEHTDKV